MMQIKADSADTAAINVFLFIYAAFCAAIWALGRWVLHIEPEQALSLANWTVFRAQYLILIEQALALDDSRLVSTFALLSVGAPCFVLAYIIGSLAAAVFGVWNIQPDHRNKRRWLMWLSGLLFTILYMNMLAETEFNGHPVRSIKADNAGIFIIIIAVMYYVIGASSLGLICIAVQKLKVSRARSE